VQCRHGGSLFEKCLRDTSICDGGCRFLHLTFYVLSLSPYTLYDVLESLLTLRQTVAGYILQAPVFTSALMLAFVYTFAQDNRGQKAHFVILQIPVEFLPWAMLTLTLILGGLPAALQQGTGVVAAHLYDFLTRLYPTFQGGRNYIQTPNVIKRLFGADQTTTTKKPFGTSIRPGQALPQQPTAGWGSGLSGSWGGRGQGRRLGGG
jgi:Derlin-2/3